MERETQNFKTSRGTEVVLKSYITGGESNAIQAEYLKDAKIEMFGNIPKVTEVHPTIELTVSKKRAEIVIVSINGKTDNVWKNLEELPSDEYDEIFEQIDQITSKKKKPSPTQ